MAELILVVGTNTWLTMAEAEEYFIGRLNPVGWSDNPESKGPALVTAYKQINALANRVFPSAATDAMKEAQCEQANFLLAFGDSMERRDAMREAGVSILSFGGSGGFSESATKVSSLRKGDGYVTMSPYALQLLEGTETVDGAISVTDIERDDSVE